MRVKSVSLIIPTEERPSSCSSTSGKSACSYKLAAHGGLRINTSPSAHEKWIAVRWYNKKMESQLPSVVNTCLGSKDMLPTTAVPTLVDGPESCHLLLCGLVVLDGTSISSLCSPPKIQGNFENSLMRETSCMESSQVSSTSIWCFRSMRVDSRPSCGELGLAAS